MHKLGDKVKIRQWSDMEKEFGLDEGGDIDCRCFFAIEMKKYCGRIGKVVCVHSGGFYDLSFDGKTHGWYFSDDMFEKEKTE